MSINAMSGVEIERKYIIKMPDISLLSLQPEYTQSEILQIYLPSKNGETHRIRYRKYADRKEFTETKKIHIDKMSSEEIEDFITEEQFSQLSKQLREGSVPLKKVRHTFVYLGNTIEIDIYPQWINTAIMEIELRDRAQKVELPPFIQIICEVTGNKAYSNSSMSRKFPDETK